MVARVSVRTDRASDGSRHVVARGISKVPLNRLLDTGTQALHKYGAVHGVVGWTIMNRRRFWINGY